MVVFGVGATVVGIATVDVAAGSIVVGSTCADPVEKVRLTTETTSAVAIANVAGREIREDVRGEDMTRKRNGTKRNERLREISLIGRPPSVRFSPSEWICAKRRGCRTLEGSVVAVSDDHHYDGEIRTVSTIRRFVAISTAACVAAVAVAILSAAILQNRNRSSVAISPLPSRQAPAGGTTVPDATTTTPVAGTTPITTSPITTTPVATTPIATTPVATPLPCPAADGSAKRTTTFPLAPPLCIDTEAGYQATIETTEGTIRLALDPIHSPLATNSFVYLARYHFYDGLLVHRVVPDFVMQTGDPTGSGSGGPGYTFPDELPMTPGYPIGAVAMANLSPAHRDSNGSQFFIVVGNRASTLDPLFPLFGRVTDGLDVARSIASFAADRGSGKPTKTVTVLKVSIAAQNERRRTTTVTTTSTTTANPTAALKA